VNRYEAHVKVMARLSDSRLDMDEIMREWFMALEYVARTIGNGAAESEQVPSDAARIRDEEVERRAAPMKPKGPAQRDSR
jgi:hypothetical protein